VGIPEGDQSSLTTRYVRIDHSANRLISLPPCLSLPILPRAVFKFRPASKTAQSLAPQGLPYYGPSVHLQSIRDS
jgi:hypothetical protein